MNLKHLRYFLYLLQIIYHYKSQKLFVSQPTLSYAINFLERRIEMSNCLFLRASFSKIKYSRRKTV